MVWAWVNARSCCGRRLSNSAVSAFRVFTWAEVFRYSSRLATISASNVSTSRWQPSSLKGVWQRGHTASWSLAPSSNSFLAARSLPSTAARSRALWSWPVWTAMAFRRSRSVAKARSCSSIMGPSACNCCWLVSICSRPWAFGLSRVSISVVSCWIWDSSSVFLTSMAPEAAARCRSSSSKLRPDSSSRANASRAAASCAAPWRMPGAASTSFSKAATCCWAVLWADSNCSISLAKSESRRADSSWPAC